MVLAAIVFVLAWLVSMGLVWLLWRAQHSARIERVTRRLTGGGATAERSRGWSCNWRRGSA
jgi:lipoprotein signal peptidase